MRTFKKKFLTLILAVGLSTIACGMEQSGSNKQRINKEFQLPQPLKISLYISAGFTITYITYRLGKYTYLKIQESKMMANQRVSTDIVPDIIKG